MIAIHFESPMNDAQRRERLYAGDIFVQRARESSRALCALAREMAAEAFAPWIRGTPSMRSRSSDTPRSWPD